jgi:hypothetical protein
VVKCTVAAVVGFAMALTFRLTGHTPPSTVSPGFPIWVREYYRIVGAACTLWPWNLLTEALLLVLLASVRFKGPRAWAVAYGAGGILGVATVRLLL